MKSAAAAAILLICSLPARSQQAAPPPQWLKVYTYEPYEAYWHVKLRVADLAAAMPKAVKALEKVKGESVLPLANSAFSPVHKYQQLSYRVPPKSGDRVLKQLRAIGTIESARQSPSDRRRTAEEVKDKLARLQSDMNEAKDWLPKTPALAALGSELAAHLANLDQLYRTQEARILLNIEIQERKD